MQGRFFKRYWQTLGFIALVLSVPWRLHAQDEKPNYEPRPLPAAEKIPTHADFQAQLLAEYEDYAKQYAATTKDPEEVRDEAQQFIREAGRVEVYGYYVEPKRELVVARGKKVRAAGSTDPLVSLLLLYCDLDERNDRTKAAGFLEKLRAAYTVFPTGGYDKKLLAYLYSIHLSMTTAAELRVDKKLRKGVKLEPVIAAIIAWLNEEKSKPERQRIVWYFIHDTLINNEKLSTPIMREQAGHDWLHLLMMGRKQYLTALSNDPRRRDQANVEQYRAALKDVITTYKAAHQLLPQFPEAALAMIEVANADSETGESPREWFDNTVRAEFDCPEAYKLYRWQFLHRLDHPDKTLSFAIECAKTERYDTEVPFVILDALVDFEKSYGLKPSIWTKPEAHGAALTMLANCLKAPQYRGKPHTDETRLWITALMAAVHLRAEQYEQAAALWDRPTDKQMSMALERVGIRERLELVKQWAKKTHDYTPIRNFAKKAVKARSVEDLTPLRAELKQLAPQFPAEKQKSWVAFGEELLAGSEKLLAGQKHEIRFTPDLFEYLNRGGWKLMEDGSLRPQGDSNLPLPIVHPAGPMEVTLDVSILDKYTEHNGPIFGVVFANGTEHLNFPPRWFGIIPGKGNVLPTDKEYGSPFPHRVTGAKENKLRIRVWPEYAEFFVNQECVYSQGCPEFYPSGQMELIGCGTLNVSEVRIKNIAVTPLSEECPPFDPEARVAYFSEALKKHDDPRMRRWRAGAYMRLERFQDALQDYREVLRHDPSDVAVLQFQARVCHYEKEYAEELAALENLNKLWPDAPYSLSELAWCLAASPEDKCRDPDRAIKLAQQVNSYSKWGESRAWFSIAAAHLAKQDYKKAAEIINRYKKVEYTGEDEYRLSLLRTALEKKTDVRALPHTKPSLEQVHETVYIRK
jgi:hypothetical protein